MRIKILIGVLFLLGFISLGFVLFGCGGRAVEESSTSTTLPPGGTTTTTTTSTTVTLAPGVTTTTSTTTITTTTSTTTTTVTLPPGVATTTSTTTSTTTTSTTTTTIGFTAHTIDPDFDGASSVFGVDLDSDGDIDVVAVAEKADEIAWYENDRSENLTKHSVTSTFESVKKVYAADLDNDADIDLVGGCFTGSGLAWFENNGSQNFTTHVLDADASVFSIYVADLNGDDFRDIVVGDSSTISWWENNQDQTFTKHSLRSAFTGDVYAVDIDDDGDPDLLSAHAYSDTIRWWDNSDGLGDFTERIISDDYIDVRSVLAVDFDQDGDIDVLSTSGSSNEVSWWQNNGSQSFTYHVIDNGIYQASFAWAGDLDGDSEPDVLVRGNYNVYWLHNDGSAESFSQHTICNITFDFPMSFSLLDIDQDGDIDLFGAYYGSDDVVWWENSRF